MYVVHVRIKSINTHRIHLLIQFSHSETIYIFMWKDPISQINVET